MNPAPVILVAIALLASSAAGARGAGPETASRETAKEAQMKIEEHRSGTWTPGLDEAEKQTLYAIAADTLKWCVAGRKGRFDLGKYKLTPKLETNFATFVTLKIGGELRGCIGSLAPSEPLYLSVHHNAVNAAENDYRFRPVEAHELACITIDVSILSPIREISSIEDFKLGQQGIILAKGMSRAVFLPEVALEQKWTKEDTLMHLSLKAGLDRNAWKSGARFSVFESVVLSIAGKQ